jgi:hypothetical protein
MGQCSTVRMSLRKNYHSGSKVVLSSNAEVHAVAQSCASIWAYEPQWVAMASEQMILQ